MKFKQFLLFEGKAYLSQKVGDILTALQNLQEDAAGMSTRSLQRRMEQVVDHIRKILHGHWDDGEVNNLKAIQKVGVAIMKSLDETDGNLEETIASCVSELENLVNKLEEPLNSLGSEKSAIDTERDSMLNSDDEMGSEIPVE